MNMGDLLRLFVIVIGIYLLLMALLSLSKRKMTEQFCLAWAVLAALMIIAGILLNPSQLGNFMNIKSLGLIMIIVCGILWGMWFISTQVSILMRKNQELAMQISLLNEEMVEEKALRSLKRENKNEKNTVCN